MHKVLKRRIFCIVCGVIYSGVMYAQRGRQMDYTVNLETLNKSCLHSSDTISQKPADEKGMVHRKGTTLTVIELCSPTLYPRSKLPHLSMSGWYIRVTI